MDTSTLVLLSLSLLLLFLLYWKSPASAAQGLRNTGLLLIEVGPRIVAALLLVGLMQVIIPQDTLARWIGQDSGLRGILIGAGLGTVTPGGPITHFPLVTALYKAGVGVGPLVAYLSAWSLLSLQRILMWELPFLGPKVVAVRVFVSLLFPMIAGWLAQQTWARLRL